MNIKLLYMDGTEIDLTSVKTISLVSYHPIYGRVFKIQCFGNDLVYHRQVDTVSIVNC